MKTAVINDKRFRVVCEQNSCVGCMACVEICPKNAITIHDTLLAYNAIIDEAACVNCNLCEKKCQNNNEISLLPPSSWYQGWTKNERIRSKSSSGGLATELAISFVKKGGIVCSCLFKNGEFKFEFAKNVSDVMKFAGSKYVKSNPMGIYKEIKILLSSGERVLFIGLPCQANAIRLYIGNELQDRLFTVDLICHGTPSKQLLRDYMKQCKYPMDKIESIEFRNKILLKEEKDKKTIVQAGSLDPYLLVFLCGLDYTENCYTCKFASIERGSDLTLGDSWGSDLPVEEQKKGISLILCQTNKGAQLLDNAEVVLYDVDLEKAMNVNDQLRGPTKKTDRRDLFFKMYKKGNFKLAAFCGLPNKYIRQIIKAVLLKMNIIQRGSINYGISIKLCQNDKGVVEE